MHDLYAGYYREALRRGFTALGGRYEEQAMGRFPKVLQKLRRVRDAYALARVFKRVPRLKSAFDGVSRLVEGDVQAPARAFAPLVAQVVITDRRGSEHKVCIDTADFGKISSPELCAWSDVYFKTNYWPSLSYPAKVAPLCNLDPLVISQLETLRAHRSRKKRYDVSFIVRVWGGKNEVDGVEHNLRLLESVARAPGSKYIHAYLVAGDIAASSRRLDRCGIRWSTRPLPARRLWEISAESRLNVIRLGMHDCLPWRFTGALALGSCIVLDRAPVTRWHVPLSEGEHFLDLGVEVGLQRSVAPAEQYDAIPDKIAAWLADGEKITRIAKNNAAYFDQQLDPQRLGIFIADSTERLAPQG